ncbi:uncharacterized protein LOC144792096 isoform X2 [Lissotriton helveticus]
MASDSCKHVDGAPCCSHGSSVTSQSVHQTLDEMDFERGIWSAAMDGDLERVKKFIKKGADPSLPDKSGYTALVSGDHFQGKGQVLRQRAADVSRDHERPKPQSTCIQWAIQEDKQEEKRKKLSKLNDTRIRLDSLEDLQNIVNLKKRKKRAKHIPQPRSAPPQEITGPVDTAQFLQAALENQRLVVDKYLDDGGDPNVSDQFRCTALHRACVRGHLDLVERLLEAGATLEPRDMLGATPVFWACRGGHLDILKKLLSRGAKITRRDKLWSSPLHVAVRTGHCNCVEHLIGCGASINAQDKEGDTPMHDAIRLGRFKAMQTLLLYGADLSIRNEEGLTPVDLVKDWQTGIRDSLKSVADRWQPCPRN